MKQQLPQPSDDAKATSRQLVTLIQEEIRQNGGRIPFSRFMAMALYTPALGYYSGGSSKIGAEGDFVTAPSLTPLFARTLALQLTGLLPQSAGNIYEFGAGTGELASGLLNSLSDGLSRYFIIEISPELAERQRHHIQANVPPEVAAKVEWLTALPECFDGIIIGNEVLDAMPCEIIKYEHDRFWQICVGIEHNQLTALPFPLEHPVLLKTAAEYFPDTAPYTSELHPAQHAFVRTLAERLERGAMLFIDYGFDAAQYYHPQRSEGTFIGHYRHHTVHDPFFNIGLTDLTAHVNFTDIAVAATEAGLDLIGYTAQAHFLLNLGITSLLENVAPADHPTYIKEAAAVQKLLAPQEMGELFKVIAFGRNIDTDWQGFAYGDICHKL